MSLRARCFTRCLLILVAALVLLPGCARQLTRIEVAVNELTRDQRRLEQQQERLIREVEALRSMAERESREGGAELGSQLGTLERTLREVLAVSEEQQALLRRLQGRVDLAVTGPPPAAAETTESGEEAGAEGLANGGTDIFDAAFADYTRGSFDLARQGFEELLAKFPTSDLADDAAYWVGETWYSQSRFTQARDGFEAVVARFPEGDKVAPALLKLGYSYLELDETERARDAFRRLRSEYPDSDEALIAQHKLDSLGSR